MILGPARGLASINARLQQGIAAGENVFELIDEQKEKDDGKVREIKINVYLNGANLDRYKDSNIEILAPQTSVELLFFSFEFEILVILL